MDLPQEQLLDKPLKQMLKEFAVLKEQVAGNSASDPQLLKQFIALKNSLLNTLEQKEQESQAEIQRSKSRKNLLVKKLANFDAIRDQKIHDEIIKEMEEYTRIKRFRHAQLASIQRNIDELKKQ